MTNETARTLSIPLSFLDKGMFNAQIWQDGKTISTLDKTEITKAAKDTLEFKLAASGGAVAVLRKK
jgi:alpha-glucosidase